MDIECKEVGGAVLFKLPDELEADAFNLKEKFSCYTSEKDFLIIDFSITIFVGTPVLAALLYAHLKVSRRGGAIILIHLSSKIRTLLSMTRLDQVFILKDSLEEALEYVQNR